MAGPIFHLSLNSLAVVQVAGYEQAILLYDQMARHFYLGRNAQERNGVSLPPLQGGSSRPVEHDG